MKKLPMTDARKPEAVARAVARSLALLSSDAEILAYAREQVRWFRDHHMPAPFAECTAVPWLTPQGGDEMMRLIMTRMAASPEGLLVVFQHAVQGWGYAMDVMHQLVIQFHHAGVPFPPCLAAFNQLEAAGRLPPRAHAGQPARKFLRDVVTWWLVRDLCERFGLKATRFAVHKDRRGELSACGYVFEAMAAEGLAAELGLRKERAIESIWAKYKPILSPI